MMHETDISFLDKPEILEVAFPLVYLPFYSSGDTRDVLPNGVSRFIEADEGIEIGCGFWNKEREYPTILYFHGNGETVAGHDWIAGHYIQRGMNFFVVDYRGYGLSGGKPTITNLVRDPHAVLKGFIKIIQEEGYSNNLFLMGRSLGSIPAIELAYHYQGQFKGLIIESGTASNLGGIWTGLEMTESERIAARKFQNVEKIKSITIPTCIIHGERDHIIPVQEGIELYEKSGASDKEILIIPEADHNNLMLLGYKQYFQKIEEFVLKIL